MNAGGMNNIHVNPKFVPKCQAKPKIHLNPTFNHINGHSTSYYVPAPEFGNEMENINGFNYATSSSYDYYNSTLQNPSIQCQDYSSHYVNVPNLYEVNDSNRHANNFHHTLNDIVPTHDKFNKYSSTDYLTSLHLPNASENLISNSESENFIDNEISFGIIKPVNKSVIMGQRMIKNQHVNSSRSLYSIDHRMKESPPRSPFGKTNHLLNHRSFRVNNNLVKKSIIGNNYMQTVHSTPVPSVNSVFQNTIVGSSNCCNSMKEDVLRPSAPKTPSKSDELVSFILSNVKGFKSPGESNNKLVSKPFERVSTSIKSPTFESRTPFFKSSMKLIRNDTLRKSAKYIREDILVKKRKYAVKTKTKLIRRNSLNSKYPKFGHVSKLSKFRRSLRLKKGTLLKAREKMLSSHYSRSITNKFADQKQTFKSKYKFVKDGTLISRYKVNRNPQLKVKFSSPPAKSNKNTWLLKLKRNVKKSDKFININGSLYKSTAMSLKKHDISSKLKKKKSPSPKVTSKKFSFRNSKFVYRRQNSAKLESGTLIEIVRRKKLTHFKRINDYCFFYNKYGKCKKQNKGCPFIHDPTKIAICTRFLQGSCTEKDCTFSHMMDKSKMPVCSHFQDGGCSKENCQYRHVRVNPKAPVCKNFLKGHCPQGEECKKKHILICEDFNKDGTCPRGKKCPLSHRKPKTKTTKRSKLSTITSKRKKPKTKGGKKVGILGLVCNKKEIKDSKHSSSNNRNPSSSNRYFNCPDGEDETRSKQDLSTNHEITPTKATMVDFELKRKRILQKLDILKKNYHIGNEGSVECKDNNSDLCSYSENGTVSGSVISNEHASSPFKLQYLPLPEVMPSFIPLVMPEREL